jgi:hypothetical protein
MAVGAYQVAVLDLGFDPGSTRALEHPTHIPQLDGPRPVVKLEDLQSLQVIETAVEALAPCREDGS